MKPGISRRDLLKLAALAPLAYLAGPMIFEKPRYRAQAGAPNLLVLVFDALSASHMSLYGYRRETTPNIARFAASANVYHAHYAGGNFTTPGTATLLTGTYPWSHRAFHLQGLVEKDRLDRNIFAQLANLGYYQTAYSHNLLVMSLLHQFRRDLDNFVPTRDLCLIDDEFADRLFFPDYTNAFLSEWQFLRGNDNNSSSLFFSHLHRALRFTSKRRVTEALGSQFPRGIPELHNLFFILEDAFDWLIDLARDLASPFFSYIHVLPPHEPYHTRVDFVDIFRDGWQPATGDAHPLSKKTSPTTLAWQRRLYDEYLAYADAEFGRLMAGLEAAGRLKDTYIVLTADHGESFSRGVLGHVTPLLHDPLVHIPLLVHVPGQAIRRDFYTPTSAADILPTLVTLAGGNVPDWTEGRLLPGFGGVDDENRSVFSMEAKSNPKAAPLTEATLSLVRGSYKMTHYAGYPGIDPPFELYDLKADPEEMSDLYSPSNDLAANMQQEILAKLKDVNLPFERQ